MRSILRLVAFGLLYGLLLLLTTIWFSFFPALNIVLNVSLLGVVVLSATRGPWFGLGGALLGTWLGSLFSTFPTPVLAAGLFGASVTVSLLGQRVVSGRSTASFLATVSGGTIAYYIAVGAGLLLWRVLQPTAGTPMWNVWLLAPLCQVFVHPLLAWALWIISGRDRQYATAQLQTQQTF